MNFTTPTATLLTISSIVEKVSGRNLTLANLNGVYVEASKGQVILRATNLDVAVEIKVPAKVEEDGVASIPGSMLSQILSNSYKGDSVSVVRKDGTLSIKTGDGLSTIKILPDEDFPTLPSVVDGNKITLKAKDFIDGIANVWHCASTSTIKPELASVYVYPDGKNLIFVATDSFRLAEKKVAAQFTGEFDYMLIPSRNIPEIIKVLEIAEGEVELTFNDHQLSFTFDSVHLTTRLTDGVFPDYRQIIPKQRVAEVTVLTKDLQQACKRTSMFSDKFNQVQFSIQPSKKICRVIAKNPDVGESVTDLDAVIEGEELDISFNVKYISEVFQALQADSVSLSFSGTAKPLVIKGVSNASFLYLVMPMNR